jgi:HemY protein
MRLLLRFILIFAAAAGLAVLAHFNPGNVVLFYPPYRVDMSLNLFLLLLALVFFAIYLLLSAIRVTQSMPGRVSAYRQGRRERESNRALRDAIKALFEGRFGHAEKAATKASLSRENTGVASLIAARAAHWMHEYDRRDGWLAATEKDSGLRTARLMTGLELLVDEHQYERAQETIAELNATGTRHIQALRLILRANQQAGNWPEVLRLVHQLDKYKALHPSLSNRLRELAYEALLSDSSQDDEGLRRIWKSIPAEERVKPYIALRAAKAFDERGMKDEARSVIEKSLSVEWDDRLVQLYRDSAADEGTPALLAQIERCEEWAQKRPADAELLLTLGTLCLKQKLWGKAQHYLEQTLAAPADAKTQAAAHLNLGQLHEALSQGDQAGSHYRQAAMVIVSP